MIILITISAIILAGIAYYFPLQRFLAEYKYIQYAAQQGVTPKDINSKKVFKDYKQGGYFIVVKYNNDPDHRYVYHYFLVERLKSGVLFNKMRCKVYDRSNHQLDDFMHVKYKPLGRK